MQYAEFFNCLNLLMMQAGKEGLCLLGFHEWSYWGRGELWIGIV